MNRQVSFHAMAEQELNDASSYYNALRPGLGLKTVTETAVSCIGTAALLCSDAEFYYTVRHDSACGHTGGQCGGGRL